MLLSSPVAPTLDLFDLPSLTFDPADPLRLRAPLEDARRRSGARAVVDLLVAALTRRSVRSDTEIEPYLGQLKSACRQTGRYRDALPVFQRIATLNPARRHEMAAELAVAHLHLGEAAKGIALLETAYRGQRRLGARRRSFAFCLAGEVAATVLRQPDLARAIADLGRTIPVTALPFTASDSTVDFGDVIGAAEAGPTVEVTRTTKARSNRSHLRLVPTAA